MEQQFKYFSSASETLTSPRFGTDKFIGGKIVVGKGIVADPGKVVRLPAGEVAMNYRAYMRAINERAIVKRTAEQYSAYLEKKTEKERAKAESEKEQDVDGPDEELGGNHDEEANQQPEENYKKKRAGKGKKSGGDK
jgi:hypothetical protein